MSMSQRQSNSAIRALKLHFMDTKKPFYGEGSAFRTAIKELREEGCNIIYDRKTGDYYNMDTVDPAWLPMV